MCRGELLDHYVVVAVVGGVLGIGVKVVVVGCRVDHQDRHHLLVVVVNGAVIRG